MNVKQIIKKPQLKKFKNLSSSFHIERKKNDATVYVTPDLQTNIATSTQLN